MTKQCKECGKDFDAAKPNYYLCKECLAKKYNDGNKDSKPAWQQKKFSGPSKLETKVNQMMEFLLKMDSKLDSVLKSYTPKQEVPEQQDQESGQSEPEEITPF